MLWARRVKERGVFLEFPDVYLFARNRGIALQVLVWKEGRMTSAVDVEFGYVRLFHRVPQIDNHV